MKILAVSGTPHKSGGASTALLNQLLEGVKSVETSAQCETVFLSEKKINYCKGCAACLVKEKDCAQKDDMKEIVEKMFAADGIIFSSPVYVLHVTAQMKTFIDRLLAYGHRPRFQGRYGAAVCVSAGMGDEDVARYLSDFLSGIGASSVGAARAIAIGPGMFKDNDAAFANARRVGESLAHAIIEKWQLPISSLANCFQVFLLDLVKNNRNLFKEDFRFWCEKGVLKPEE